MDLTKGQHVTVIGITGTGKTYFVRNCLLPAFDRIIIVDTEEFDFNDFPAVPINRAIQLAKSDYRFACRVIFKGDGGAQDIARLEQLCTGLLKYGHDLAVYLDEVADFSSPSQISPNLKALLRKGRKRRITAVVGTQRPQDMNKVFVANAVHRIWFFVSDYDSDAVSTYAPFLEERANEIPYGSFRSFYQAPDGSIIVLEPCDEYDWGPRLRGKK